MIAWMTFSAMALAGLVTSALPFTAWYVADTPTGPVSTAGIDVAGELWTLVAAGALTVGVAVFTMVRRHGGAPTPRAALLVAAVLCALAVGWALQNVLDIPAVLEVLRAGGEVTRVDPDLVQAAVEPAAYLGVAAPAIGGMSALTRLLEEGS
ncbi:MAG TPA: hypothetical protein VJB36_08180 [Methylomirabilota bacterium]|nr:hypothetical protein [Methylomirabilota bacterium]